MNFLIKIGLVDFVYSLFGVFTVTPGLGIDKNIHKAKEIIKIGGINIGEPLDVDEYRTVDEVTNIFYKVISHLYARG